jgi:hypothetical protein
VCSSFLSILLYQVETGDTCVRHDVNPIPVNMVL